MTRTVVCLTRVCLALACLAAVIAPGCNGVDKKYSQTELNALQTREFNYNFDQTFDSAVGALFDLGYTVYTSDKRAGLLGARAGSQSVQLKLDPAGEGRTSVRVSTSSGGQAHVDKGRIDDVLNTIDRRLIASPAKAGKP